MIEYNRRLATMLFQISTTSEESRALEIFSNQQGNFLAAVKYCDRFEADREELLDYFNYLSSLFSNICSLDSFICELSAKINIFQGKEKQCAQAILLWVEYYNGDFHQAFVRFQQLLPLDRISSLDRSIRSEELLAYCARDIYQMEGEALWATEYAAQYHILSFIYPGQLLYILDHAVFHT